MSSNICPPAIHTSPVKVNFYIIVVILVIIISSQGLLAVDSHHKNQITIQQTHGIITTETNELINYAMKEDLYYNKSFVPEHERVPVSLKCAAIYSKSVHHPPNNRYVRWFKYANRTSRVRRELFNSTKHSILIYADGSFVNTELLIKSPDANDAGPYVCLFRTVIDSVTFEEVVEAHMSPVIDLIYTRRQSMRIKEGSETTLQCTAQGYPLPQIYWMRNNESYTPEKILLKPIPSTLGEEEMSLTIVTERIQFSSVNRSSHRAYMWCYATNTLGTDKAVVYLRIVDPLAPLWPALGIALCIIILVVIITLTEVKNKKQRKAIKGNDENITMKEISRLQSTTEDPEIRQRFV